MNDDINFAGKSFCFTGKMADLKRTQAEREARARGGLTTKVVNMHLDYLVVGSIPATGWKFGNYGRKIEAAQSLVLGGSTRIVLMSEQQFIDALGETPPSNCGAIDGKVIVITYSFVTPPGDSFDREGLESLLEELRSDQGCHVRMRVTSARVRNELFARRGSDASLPDDYLIYDLRIVKHQELEISADEIVHAFDSGVRPLFGVDGDLRWFERTEGSADYVRLIREIPEDLQVPEL